MLKTSGMFLLKFGLHSTIWASTGENLSSGVANNTGADQPAHPRSLISTFVIRLWKVLYVNLLQLVSVAEETGLKYALAETPKTGFLVTRPIS